MLPTLVLVSVPCKNGSRGGVIQKIRRWRGWSHVICGAYPHSPSSLWDENVQILVALVFQTCCIADFQAGRASDRSWGRRIGKPAIPPSIKLRRTGQQTWKSALQPGTLCLEPIPRRLGEIKQFSHFHLSPWRKAQNTHHEVKAKRSGFRRRAARTTQELARMMRAADGCDREVRTTQERPARCGLVALPKLRIWARSQGPL